MNKAEAGTVLITGANGSLGLSFVQQLLAKHPLYFALLTVRNSSDQDPNTKELQKVVSSHPSAETSIEVLDLGSLSDVRAFAEDVAKRVATGKIPPISAIVCNAFAWSLVGIRYSADNHELGFQVSHLSQFLLVLKLVNSMNKRTGRIVMLGSVSHDAKNNNSANPLGPKIPEDLEELIRPSPDKPGEEMSRGFRRYGNSKLANVMFMHSLNKKLLHDISLKGITAIAMDPGGMAASRAFRDAPFAFRTAMRIVGYIVPVAEHFTSALRTTKSAAIDLVAMTVGPEANGKRGYFMGQKPVTSSEDSHDEGLREKVWKACEKWAKLEESETALKADEGEY